MVTSFLTRRQALGGDDQFPVGVTRPGCADAFRGAPSTMAVSLAKWVKQQPFAAHNKK
jgi:hypothetical protein